MDYSEYEAEDFLMDERFREWVLENQYDTFWTTFIQDYPQQEETIQQAKQVLLGLSMDQENLSETEAEELRLSIYKELDKKSLNTLTITSHRRQWLKIAAGFSGFLLLSTLVLWWYMAHQPEVYETAYGEIKQIELPDGSSVTLNANSKLEWLSGESLHDEREVFLEGEAFFDVLKKAQGQKFIVHTDNMQLEVLGTTFNVKRRRGQTQVVLSTGKVALQNIGTGEKTLMQPGDLVSLTNEVSSFTYQKVNPELYTSWTARKLLINNTTLQEIAQIIEDTYGYTVVIEGKSLKERKFSVTTTVALGDLNNLLQLIEITFKIDISQTNKQIIMKEK